MGEDDTVELQVDLTMQIGALMAESGLVIADLYSPLLFLLRDLVRQDRNAVDIDAMLNGMRHRLQGTDPDYPHAVAHANADGITIQ